MDTLKGKKMGLLRVPDSRVPVNSTSPFKNEQPDFPKQPELQGFKLFNGTVLT